MRKYLAIIIISLLLLLFAIFSYFHQHLMDISFIKIIVHTYEEYLRIILCSIMGLLIGLDRTFKSKPLGIKTYTLLCIGSGLITIISIQSVNHFAIEGLTMMDPMRLVAQLLPAVGFVGAGAIYFTNNKVKGLTSAAFVFFTAAVGVGIGAGFYGLTIFSTLIAFLFLSIEQNVESKFFDKDEDDE